MSFLRGDGCPDHFGNGLTRAVDEQVRLYELSRVTPAVGAPVVAHEVELASVVLPEQAAAPAIEDFGTVDGVPFAFAR